MGLFDQLSSVLQQYSGNAASGHALADVNQHFDQVAQAAPPNVLAEGLSAAFRSNSTPTFGQMLSTLFNQSSGELKAGIVNQLLASAGPGVLSQLTAGGSGPALASLLGSSQSPVTPEQAQQLAPEAVQQLATHAEKADPSVIDKASSFYADHPTLVKTLGGAALTVALAKLAENQRLSSHVRSAQFPMAGALSSGLFPFRGNPVSGRNRTRTLRRGLLHSAPFEFPKWE